jgi:uncharacterized protein YqeY
MSITDKLNEQIKTAMKSKDSLRLNVVRMLKAKILNVNARGDVSDDEALKIFKTYAKGLKETISIARENNKEDAAVEAEKELAIVDEFLPEEMSEEEIEKVVSQIISENDLSGMSAMGQVMSKAMAELKNSADGAVVKNVAVKLLKEQ